MNSIELKAYAKINIGLDITGKLDNGYHLLKSVMQQIDLYDVITVEKCGNAGEIILTCNNPEIPVDSSNLACKAAKILFDNFSLDAGVKIHIDKRIPMAAGMAGGSTDGAAVLKGMNQIFELGLSEEALCEYGVKLGADIPFCIKGGIALTEGIGEVMSDVKGSVDMYVVIAKPPISVSTKYVYETLDSKEYVHPDMDGVLEGYATGNLSKIISSMGNVLEEVTANEYEIIDILKKDFLKCGANGSIMSGSGPTVFGIFDNKEAALTAEEKMKQLHGDIFVKAANMIGK